MKKSTRIILIVVVAAAVVAVLVARPGGQQPQRTAQPPAGSTEALTPQPAAAESTQAATSLAQERPSSQSADSRPITAPEAPEASGSKQTARPDPKPASAQPPGVKPAQPTPAPKPKMLPRLVDLGAKSCIPCKMMAGVLDELTKEYEGRLKVVFYDVWENPQAGKDYGIRVIPTQVFFDASGKEFFRHEGYMSKEDILAKFKEHGVNLGAGK